MPDPTESVITATFGAAFGLFTLAAVARQFMKKPHVPTPDAMPQPADADSTYQSPTSIPDTVGHPVEAYSPYQSPISRGTPPALPVGKVTTWAYNSLDLVGMGLIYSVFFLLVVSSLRVAAEKELVLDPAGLLVSIGFQFVSAGIVVAMMITRVRPVEWLGLRWQGWYWIFLISPATVMGMWMFFAILQASGYMQWMETLGVEAVQDTVKLLQESNDPAVLVLMSFAAVVAAPLCEEIVFRGYLYGAGKKFAGPWMAGICSALVFAAAHGSMAALLPLFVFGCVLVLLYEKTGSLWAPIAVHFCFNGATVAVQIGMRYLDLPLNSTP